MNNYSTDNNGALTEHTPLFASVWLALFSELRKNYNEWRLASANEKNRQSLENL